jgi:hypothetical protein
MLGLLFLKLKRWREKLQSSINGKENLEGEN